MKPILFLLCVLLVLTMLASSSVSALPEPDQGVCGPSAIVTSLLDKISEDHWVSSISALSGEIPALINGSPFTITGRLTRSMFTGADPSQAYNFVLAQARQWGLNERIDEHLYFIDEPEGGFYARNLVVDLPGVIHPNEVVVLSAHLDSTSRTPELGAPGAEDNASGSAALLEALRLLRNYHFDRTIRIIWFTGEEQGLLGSSAYVRDRPTWNITGVINLDMFGYDSNDDRCFELHVGRLPESEMIGQCFVGTIQSNGLNLTYDYLTDQGEGFSDHSPFWNAGVGAVEVLENYSDQSLPGGCFGADQNPNYHTSHDRIQYMNIATGFEIVRASLATAANLAGPLEMCFNAAVPQVSITLSAGKPRLSWGALPDATGYRIWRSESSCQDGWALLGDVQADQWTDTTALPGQTYRYRVEAIHAGGCFSLPSTCTPATAIFTHFSFLPVIDW